MYDRDSKVAKTGRDSTSLDAELDVKNDEQPDETKPLLPQQGSPLLGFPIEGIKTGAKTTEHWNNFVKQSYKDTQRVVVPFSMLLFMMNFIVFFYCCFNINYKLTSPVICFDVLLTVFIAWDAYAVFLLSGLETCEYWNSLS